MSRNLRDQNEQMGTVPNEYVAYEPIVKIPLGVVRNWIPKVARRDVVGVGPYTPAQFKELEDIKNILLSPSHLDPALIETTYANKATGKKIVTQKTPEVKNGELKFGLWNAQYKGAYTLVLDGAHQGQEVKNLPVSIEVVGNKVEFIPTDMPPVGCRMGTQPPLFNRPIPFDQLFVPRSNPLKGNQVYFKVQHHEDVDAPVSYAILQTFKEADNWLRTEQVDVVIWKGSNGMNVLDTIGATSMYSPILKIVEGTGSVDVILNDPPGKPLAAYLKQTCSSEELLPILSYYNTLDQPLLEFNTYLMMRAGRPQTGTSIQTPWKEPEEGVTTNWIPISMVNWKVHMNPVCNVPDLPCIACNWQINPFINFGEPNELITNFPMPEWNDVNGDYIQKRLAHVAFKYEGNSYSVCVTEGEHEILNEEYELYDLDIILSTVDHYLKMDEVEI